MSSHVNTCKLLANVIHTTPSKKYLSYIFSPQWAARRREHLAQCDYWCEICNQRPAIQVHHWTYERLGHENAQDLCAVCVRCHWRIHRSVMPVPANDNKQMTFTFDDIEEAG
jgi:hypothetical protein